MKWPHLLSILMILAMPARGSAEEGVHTEASTPRTPASTALHLIVDYLPAARYTHETLSICLRVENPGSAEKNTTLTARWLDADGKELKKAPHELACPAGGFGEYKKTLAPDDARRMTFALGEGTDGGEALEVWLLRDGEPWPETQVRNGRLATKGGAVVMPFVKRRLVEADRTWAPVKWALKWGGAGEDEAGAGVARQGATAWLPRDWRETGAENFRPLGPYPADGAPPILCVVGDILRDLGKPAPGRVVIVLPPEDLARGTDPRVYEIALSALLVRLAKRGVGEIILAGPYQYGVPLAQQERLWKTVDLVARLYSARTLRTQDRLAEGEWRADPKRAGAYGAHPNAAGRAALHNMLKDLLPAASPKDDTGK